MPRVKDFLTVAAAAEFIGVSKDTLRRWDRAGKLRAHRHPINRYRLYSRPDLEEFLRTIGATDDALVCKPVRPARFPNRKAAAAALLKAVRANLRSRETGDRAF